MSKFCYFLYFLSFFNIYYVNCLLGIMTFRNFILSIIIFIAGGVIKHFGWEAIFYLTGALSFIWVNFWFYLVYDSPEVHPR